VRQFERQELADIGVIGGSGFYELLDNVEHLAVQTPYGPPSGALAIGTYEGVRVAFLARHGGGHRYPPHKINYRANIWALASVGVTRILGPNASGSLQPHVKPGDFVVCDQFVDRTTNRESTFYDGPPVVHIGGAEPYCPELRQLAITAGRELGITVHETGTVVVIQGPRFSTRAESRWFSSAGWEVVNMTQFPEQVLARELEVCYAGISLITDYDAGLEGRDDIEAVSVAGVIDVFNSNNARVRDLLLRMLPRIPRARACICATALTGAVLG
jgi:5'-methylthioadenosine phosphorylase